MQKSKISIRILNWRDINHPLAGGAEQSLHEQAKVWIEKGADVVWYSASWNGSKKKEIIDKIRVIRMGNQFTIHLLFFIQHILGRVPKVEVCIDSFHFIPYFSKFFIRNEKIFALINEIAGELWYYNAPAPVAFFGKKIEPLIIKSYAKVPFITASDSTKNELMGIGISEGNIHIVHHGVTVLNPGQNVRKEKNPTLLFLNRISMDKGIEDMIKAFEVLRRNNKSINLWIVGKEEKARIVSDLLRKYGVVEGVKYLGFVSQTEKFKLMKRAWILVHPSKKEGWGLTVIEAASQGTPTVGYDVEGLRDSIVNNKTGILIKPSTYGIIEGVEKILSGNSLRQKFEKNSIEWAENFTWEKAGEKSWKIINES